MGLTLEEKYNLLCERERSGGFFVARSVIHKPEVSLWMILIPVLFVFHAMQIQKYKSGVKSFAENFIRTRIKALDFALEAIQAEKSPEIDVPTCFPSLDRGNEALRRVCEKQVEEIRILFRHYRALLWAEGNNFETLLKRAYGDEGKYRAFLNTLEKAEDEVNRHVTKQFQTNEAAKEVMQKIVRTLQNLRKEELEIFKTR